MAFAMSFDDFIISYFIGGSAENISVWIYNLKKLIPIVNAFSIFLILGVAIFFLLKTILERKEYVENNKEIVWKEKQLEIMYKKEFKIRKKESENKNWFSYLKIKHDIKNDIDIKIKIENMNFELEPNLKGGVNNEN
jgi:spermidine/putrescine transport system permease protein